MANPLVHACVFAAAVIIPGGLLIYFAWRTLRKRKPQSAAKAPDPFDARAAFERMYPPESLRAQSRRKQLARATALRRKKSKN
jgi:hypothetical protein